MLVTELSFKLWQCRQPILAILAGVILSASGCQTPSTRSPVVASVPIANDLGSHHYSITTSEALTQRYFNQGLILAYGFNHAEAARSFQAAYQIDPECAMCYWGEALVLGPNINAPMTAEAIPIAYALAQKALALSAQATPKEQTLIKALSKRYGTDDAAGDREKLDEAYAAAMRDVAKQYPDDAVILSLLAESLMDLHPWNFWTKQGEAKPWTAEIVSTLEKALQKDASNPLANHLYIHALEASPHAERALASAGRLPALVPGSGHLVHMPAHIYIRIGRYDDAIKANQSAVKIDRGYLEHQHTESIYTFAYVPHNHHFLWSAAIKTGRRELANEAAGGAAAHVNRELLKDRAFTGTLQHFLTLPILTQALFGDWQAILMEKAPEPELLYCRGIYHYARSLALLRLGDRETAQQERALLEESIDQVAEAGLTIFDLNQAATILKIAASILHGELAAAANDYQHAIAHLHKAVKLEDSLNYSEPKDWYLPPRQVLGSLLLATDKAKEAEDVYRQDLAYHPQNGWSLFGLMSSLRDQGKQSDADSVRRQFEEIWRDADVTLTDTKF